MLKRTEEQEAFIKELLENRPCFLSARAGTGKTTTIKMGVEALLEAGVPPQDICVIAFNKQNQEDLAKAIGTKVKTYTLHSLGFQTLRGLLPGLELKNDKLYELTRNASIRGKNARNIFAHTMRLVSCAKNWGIVPHTGTGLLKRSLIEDSSEKWKDLQEYFELWDADIEKAREILIESNKLALKERIIDFDDMTYLPIALDARIYGSPRMIVDEAQDLSPLNIAMLKKSPAKIWYVGDPFQTIYGWRGATEEIVESLGLKELPLTNCWRCSGNIISRAKRFVPDIRTQNPAGEIISEMDWLPDFKKHKAGTILGRNNADLIKLALHFRENALRCCVLGKDLSKTLISILEKLKGTTSKQLRESLREWASKMADLYPHQQSEIKDYAQALLIILSEVSGSREAEKLISQLFADKPLEGEWILSTIHKAKGQEYPTVFLLDWSPRNLSQPWQVKEDRNLRYVATTRAKEKLYIISEKALQGEKIDLDATLRNTRGELVINGELLSGGERGGGLWD